MYCETDYTATLLHLVCDAIMCVCVCVCTCMRVLACVFKCIQDVITICPATQNVQFPENWEFEEARRLFKEPDVSDPMKLEVCFFAVCYIQYSQV